MKKVCLPLLILLAAACHRDKRDPGPNLVFCGVASPAENLPWLKAKIYQFENDVTATEVGKYKFIFQAIYNDRTVFVFSNCCPYCLSSMMVKDCDGNEVNVPVNAPIQTVAVIWHAAQSPCVL